MPSLMFLLIQSHSICWLYCWIQEFPKFFKPITMGFSCLDISMIMSSSEDILVLILDIVVDMLLVVLLHINWSGVSLTFEALLLLLIVICTAERWHKFTDVLILLSTF
eukprot:122929_1